MQEANEQLKATLVEAIHELFLSEDPKHSSNFIEILNGIRSDLNLIMITDKYVEKYIWEKFRSPASMQQTLIATTATFLMGVDDIDGVIDAVVPRWIPFKAATKIVDDETITKAVEHTDLTRLLKDNYWLFFVIFTALNMRIVLETTLAHVPGQKGNQ